MISNNLDTVFACLLKKGLCTNVVLIVLDFFCTCIDDTNIHDAVLLYVLQCRII